MGKLFNVFYLTGEILVGLQKGRFALFLFFFFLIHIVNSVDWFTWVQERAERHHGMMNESEESNALYSELSRALPLFVLECVCERIGPFRFDSDSINKIVVCCRGNTFLLNFKFNSNQWTSSFAIAIRSYRAPSYGIPMMYVWDTGKDINAIISVYVMNHAPIHGLKIPHRWK